MASHDIDHAAQVLRARGFTAPKVAVVLGSGLGGLADRIEGAHHARYADIPGMPGAAVAGHAGRFVGGTLASVPVIAMQGRVHLYEGHAAEAVVLGVRVMAALGARVLIVTNAAGGIAPTLSAGSLMVIDDHLNLTGRNPLVGANEDRLGPRFPDMTHAYDAQLAAACDLSARALGIDVHHGVYAGVLGPSYETPAEVRMLRALGADAVGMSTVLEVIAARHLGVRCLGISCVTNAAAGLSNDALTHDDVQQVARAAAGRLESLVIGTIAHVGATL